MRAWRSDTWSPALAGSAELQGTSAIMPGNGQAERMNRTIKETITKAFHYPCLDALQAHVLAFVRAYNFAKHLEAFRWRIPFQAVCDAWTKDRSIFKINPRHLIPGPNP
jgi:hypothetical protein